MTSAIQCRTNEKKERSLIKDFLFPSDVTILIPRIQDTLCNPHIDYFSVYVDHFRAELRVPLFPLIIEVLGHYEIGLTQLVPNTIRVIVGFERLCRFRGMISSLALFRASFI